MIQFPFSSVTGVAKCLPVVIIKRCSYLHLSLYHGDIFFLLLLLTECNDRSEDHVTQKSSGSWVDKGFWDTSTVQKKEIDDTEKQIRGQ